MSPSGRNPEAYIYLDLMAQGKSCYSYHWRKLQEWENGATRRILLEDII